jgi:hypothetical protein
MIVLQAIVTLLIELDQMYAQIILVTTQILRKLHIAMESLVQIVMTVIKDIVILTTVQANVLHILVKWKVLVNIPDAVELAVQLTQIVLQIIAIVTMVCISVPFLLAQHKF